MNTNSLKILCLGILFSSAVSAQLYTPTGSLGSNSSGAGVGVGTNSPTSQLDIKHSGTVNHGLLYLKAATAQGMSGTLQQPFAIRLDYSNELVAYPLTTVFDLKPSGLLQVGDLSAVSTLALNKTNSDFAENIGIYSSNNFLNFSAGHNAISWGGSPSLTFRKDGFTNAVLFGVTSEGIGINTSSPEAPLHVENFSANNVSQGETNGLLIETDGHLPGNYSLRIHTAWGDDVFNVTDRGRVGINTETPLAPIHISNNDPDNINTNITNGLFINSGGHLPSNYSIHVKSAWSENAFNVTDRGHIGINTANPLAPIHIANNQASNTPPASGQDGIVNGLFIESSNANSKDNYSLKVNTELGTIFSVTDQGNVLIKNVWSANSGPTGQLNGLKILNNGFRGHDYAFEVWTGNTNKVFDITNSGHVHIGPDLNYDIPDSDKYRLYVQDGIRTEKIRIDIADLNGWADYVFDSDYQMLTTEELETFIKKYKHLPGVPSAKQVVEEGIDLAEMNKILLEKIEEMTLRIIELEKKVN